LYYLFFHKNLVSLTAQMRTKTDFIFGCIINPQMSNLDYFFTSVFTTYQLNNYFVMIYYENKCRFPLLYTLGILKVANQIFKSLSIAKNEFEYSPCANFINILRAHFSPKRFSFVIFGERISAKNAKMLY